MLMLLSRSRTPTCARDVTSSSPRRRHRPPATRDMGALPALPSSEQLRIAQLSEQTNIDADTGLLTLKFAIRTH